MRLSRRLCPWLNSYFLVSGHHTNYAKIDSAADFRSPRSTSDQRRIRQASSHHPHTSDQATGYSCDRPRTHAIAKWSLTDRHWFSLSLGCRFPHEETQDWTRTHTHTHTHTARQLCRRTLPSTSRIRLLHVPAFSALHAIFRGFSNLFASAVLS